MAWAAQTGGGWLNTGGGTRSVWVFDTPMTGIGAAVFQILDPSKAVEIVVYGSPLLDTGYGIIPDAGTGGNLDLRKWTYGTAGATLDTDAHGLTDGDNYVVEVRWVNGVISVYLNNTLTAVVYDTAGALGHLNRIGFSSSTDGARVASAKLYVLTQTFAALADVAWWVAGGTLYASDTGVNGGRSIGTFFDSNAVVIGAENLQHAILLDGTNVIDFDAALMTATPFVLTAGTMPGQSSLNTPEGTSSAKFVLSYNDRIGFLKEQYAIFSAIGDRADLDLTVDDLGKAFVWPSQVGEPLLGAIVAAKNRIIMWGRRSIWEMTGDPVLGADVTQLSDAIGGSGPSSACRVDNGIILIHGDQGLYMIPPGGHPIPLSEAVLTDIVQVENAPDTMYVSVVQDTKNHGVWIFLTPTDGSAGTHLFYDQRTGAFQPGEGGFWPIELGDDDAQPTCAMRYLGDVIVGTLDGRMLFIDKASAGEDDGADFDSLLTVQMVRPQDMSPSGGGVLLRCFDLAMGIGSDSTSLEIRGGEVPERAFDTTAWTLWRGTMAYTRQNFAPSVSSPALVLRLSGEGADWALESCQIDFGMQPLIAAQRKPALVPGTVCQPPVPDPAADPDDTGEGPGDGTTPDPMECTDCETWLAANGGALIDDGTDNENGILLASGSDWNAVLDSAYQQVQDLIIAANICTLPPIEDIWLLMYSVGSNTYYGQTYALLQTPQGTPTYRCYFRCFDQGL